MPLETDAMFLHHYEASPYAEKIRAMFGFTDSRWASVLSPPYPPRPNLQPLVGDFRRIPVAHHGADIYCDTALIATEIARLTERPELAPQIADANARNIVERAEGSVFFCAITGAPPLPLLGKLLQSNGLGGTWKFVRDRSAMMKDSSMNVPRGKTAVHVLNEFLGDLNTHLSERQSLQGDQIGYADFCVYHPIWLALSVGSVKSLSAHPGVQRWFAHMAGFGCGQEHAEEPEQAFAAIRAADPMTLPEPHLHHELLGKAVTIAPADYGKSGTHGTLVAATEDRYVLARETERCGDIHVHFPRAGYAVSS